MRFLLTGSSARKLKRSGVNLLAGRAIQYKLHPLSFIELGTAFKLNQALSWGTLPEVIEAPDKSVILVELKAKESVSPKDVRSMHRLSKQFDTPQTYVLSQDKTQRTIGETRCVHWQQGLAEIFGLPI